MFNSDSGHDAAPKRAARPSDVLLLLIVVALLGIALVMIVDRVIY